MFRFPILFCFLSICLSIKSFSQPQISFTPFEGTVYDLPGDYLQEGYGKYLSYCDVMGKITMDSLVVPKTHVYDKYFPGITMRTAYGIIFLSTMEIPRDGCYEFYLESDDGSNLWIADSLIINNDKTHKMTVKRDTMVLAKGHYPVKVWYYNAFETHFGLIFHARALPDSLPCAQEGQMKKIALDPDVILFDLNAYVITPAGKKALDKLCDELNQINFRKILVVGHTDASGSKDFNEELSLKRAQSISTYLKTKLLQPGIVIKAEGRGASDPIATSQTEGANQMNRRVEIFIQ